MLKRFFKFVVVVCFAFVLAAGAFYAATTYLPSNKPVLTDTEDTPLMPFPDLPALNVTLPAAGDTAAAIRLAADLYETACQNFRTTGQWLQLKKYTTTIMGVTANGYRYMLKNKAGEYFYNEYCFVEEGGILSALISTFSRDSTMFAERRYYNDGMEKMLREVVTDPTPTYSYDEKQNLIFNVNWKKKKTSEMAPPENAYLTDMNILAETISTAEISYNKEEKYYTLKLTLNAAAAKTTEKTLPMLRSGFGNDTAAYTSLVEEIHIWENGFPKYFRSTDQWEGQKGILGTVSATLDFHSYFHYTDARCNESSYQHILKTTEFGDL